MKLFFRALFVGLCLFSVALSAAPACVRLLVPLPPLASGAEKIVVLGAGVSGLTAARRLRAEGKDVLVLEGRDRIGGRVATDRSQGPKPIELGSSWIHGVKGNVLAGFARRAGIRTAMTDYYDSSVVYGADGRELDEATQNRLENLYRKVLRRVGRVQEGSLGGAVERVMGEMALLEEDAHLVRFAFHGEVEQDYATNASDLSARAWQESADFEGGDVLVPDGYDAVPKRLAEGLDIRLAHRVIEVAYDERGVRVTTDRGVFHGDRVIVTLPLGVLRRGAVRFSPELPERKLRAIQRLKMGTLNKLYLRFEEPFWPDVDFLTYLGAGPEEWVPFFNLQKYQGGPALIGFLAGADAERSEGETDATVAARAMKILRKVYGEGIPDPVAVKFTRWATDEFSFGSYSHPGPEATGDDFDALAEPVGARLYFAGEATSRDAYGSVHGAMRTGLREARRILRTRR